MSDNPIETTTATPAPEAAVTPQATAPEAAPNDWRATLPEELKAAPSLAKFQDPAALAKSYIEAEKLIGKKGVIVPGEGASEAEQAAFRKALGVPDAPDAYEIKVENVPAHIWNDDAAALLRQGAHQLGLTPQQAQGLASWYSGLLHQADEKAAETADAELRQEWGPRYERNTTLAAQAAKELLGPEAAAVLKSAGLAHNPTLLKALARMGEAIAPHDGSAGMGTGGPRLSPDAERQKYFTPGTPEHQAYTNPMDRGHKAAVARVAELFRASAA